MDDLKTPRPDPADPERCPVCKRLLEHLRAMLKGDDRLSAKAALYALYTHMICGHPHDRRTRRRADA
ncbi:hypothetical protein [Streptomyces sp. NBC_01530]|uniref:hypothetical protein n=1 Tax=Streptomyces sp. NBC_01530 TaxID=2903895 RepID=UPI003870BC83